MDSQNRKAVYTVIERHDGETKRSFWIRIGAAFVNRDGSYTVKLDALPVNSTLQIRDWTSREDWVRRNEAANTNGAAAATRTHADIFAGA
ncbi:MAG TPA: hypothetical protein VGH28_24905 [Polyangiaceae bacterium]|jgi:hypothetical protein